MKEEELKQILKDPKKLLDLFRVFHQLLHIYEFQLNQNSGMSNEKIGLNDSIDINFIKSDSNKSEEVKQ